MTRHLGYGPARLAGEYGARLARRISAALLVMLAALWVSGLSWLVLHYLYARPGEFGLVRHPLEKPALTVHGILALLALFLLGWFAGRHASAAVSGRRLASGWWLTLWLAALVLAGGAQFFLANAAWQAGATLVHEVLGVALILPVLAHGWHLSAVARERDRAGGLSRSQAARQRRRHPPRPPHNAHN